METANDVLETFTPEEIQETLKAIRDGRTKRLAEEEKKRTKKKEMKKI